MTPVQNFFLALVLAIAFIGVGLFLLVVTQRFLSGNTGWIGPKPKPPPQRGGYRANRSVDPRRVKPPRSPSGVSSRT